jgi:hypothetical protein
VFSLLYVFVLCIVYPVLSVSGLSILDYPSVFSNLCIVYPVLSVSGLSIFDCPSVFSNLCSVYCVPIVVGVWIVHSWLPLRFSLTFIITSTTVVYISLIPVCFTAYTITAWLLCMLWFWLFPCIPQWYFRYFRYKI